MERAMTEIAMGKRLEDAMFISGVNLTFYDCWV
jgi:hypothetical protein